MVTAQVDSRAGSFVYKAERECGGGGLRQKENGRRRPNKVET